MSIRRLRRFSQMGDVFEWDLTMWEGASGMAWVKMKGVEGLVFQPESHGKKKHNCPDCFECAWCSDARCKICLSKSQTECARRPRGKQR